MTSTIDIENVEVHQRTDKHDIILDGRKDGFCFRTNKGEKVGAYNMGSINEIVGFTPIRNWCYETLDGIVDKLALQL